MKKLNKSLKILLLLFIYKLLLDFSIIGFISKEYSYVGGNVDFNLLKFILSNLYLIIIYIFIPKNNVKPSYIFLQLHFIIMIIPMLTLYGLQNKHSEYVAAIVILFCLEICILKYSKLLKIYRIRNSKYILYVLIIMISFFVYFSMLRANGIPSLSVLNFWKVYEVRNNVVYPFLMNYLVHWQAKVINPFLITLSFVQKKPMLLAFSLSLQLLIYLITAHKSYILIPGAIIVIIKVLNKYDFFKMLSYLSSLGVLISMTFHKLFDFIFFPFIFIYRLLFLPAQIKYYYYDFFSENRFLYFSEGFIGKIFGIKFPYELGTNYLISNIYFGDPNSAANTGYLADAYANGGIWGMLIITLVLTGILIIIDSLTPNIGKNVVVGLSIFSVLGLNDLGLLTTLFTGGLGFLIVLLYLYTGINDDKSKLKSS